MNTKSEPSRYRYVASRRSTVAVSTFTPALYVLSTTLPESTFFSLVRTKAGPLPGLTCWNSVICHSWPSITRTSPFLKSAVDATRYISYRMTSFSRTGLLPGSGFRFCRNGCQRPSEQNGHRMQLTRAELGQNGQLFGETSQQLRGLLGGFRVGDDQGVLDADTAAAGQVDAGLHR